MGIEGSISDIELYRDCEITIKQCDGDRMSIGNGYGKYPLRPYRWVLICLGKSPSYFSFILTLQSAVSGEIVRIVILHRKCLRSRPSCPKSSSLVALTSYTADA